MSTRDLDFEDWLANVHDPDDEGPGDFYDYTHASNAEWEAAKANITTASKNRGA